jgi:hypothetical protein
VPLKTWQGRGAGGGVRKPKKRGEYLRSLKNEYFHASMTWSTKLFDLVLVSQIYYIQLSWQRKKSFNVSVLLRTDMIRSPVTSEHESRVLPTTLFGNSIIRHGLLRTCQAALPLEATTRLIPLSKQQRMPSLPHLHIDPAGSDASTRNVRAQNGSAERRGR